MRIRLREVFLKKTFKIFAGLNIFLLVWAIVIIAVSAKLSIRDEVKIKFVRGEVGSDKVGILCILISSAVQIVGAGIGLVGYRSFLAGSLCLKIFAVLWSCILLPNPILPLYLKFFEIATLDLVDPNKSNGIWENKLIFWNVMQTKMQCCGVHSYQDWIHSKCNCIPRSCCKASMKKKCQEVLKLPLNITTGSDLQRIEQVIYKNDCTSALRIVMNELQTFLVVFAAVLLVVELSFYAMCSHLLKLIEHHVRKIRRNDTEFEGKFGIWLLEPSDTILGDSPTNLHENNMDTQENLKEQKKEPGAVNLSQAETNPENTPAVVDKPQRVSKEKEIGKHGARLIKKNT